MLLARREASRRAVSRNSPDIPRIALRFRGGLGDHIIGARFLRDLQAEAGAFEFDVFTERTQLTQWLLGDFPGLGNCYPAGLWKNAHRYYPLAAEINQLFSPIYRAAHWDTIGRVYPRLEKICKSTRTFLDEMQVCIQHQPYLDGHLARVARFMNSNRLNLMQTVCGLKCLGHELPLKLAPNALKKFGVEGRPYITAGNGVDEEFEWSAPATKLYPYFDDVLAKLKNRFPTLSLIQVGANNSIPLRNVDACLVNKTSLEEVGALIKHAILHLDSEGGLVHLASCVGTRSCVIFGPTSKEYFGYADNLNIGPATCGDCFWTSKHWLKNCVRGFEKPRCLYELTPDFVCESVEPYIIQELSVGTVGTKITEEIA